MPFGAAGDRPVELQLVSLVEPNLEERLRRAADALAATTDAEDEAEAGSAETAIGLNEGVSVYQLTDKGLALQVTLQGTKYWKDDDLN